MLVPFVIGNQKLHIDQDAVSVALESWEAVDQILRSGPGNLIVLIFVWTTA